MSTKNLYEILGVRKTAELKEIKKAYYDLAREHHPDKGGSTEHFQEIQQAFDVLSDEQKRAQYDMTGSTEELPGGGMRASGMPAGFPGGFAGGFPFDIGSMFGMFGANSGGGPRRRVRRPKGPNKNHEIGMRLEDYYKGRSIQLKFERQVFCTSCKGEGCTHHSVCGTCGGSGSREQHIMVGPGMAMVQRGPCEVCSGEGRKKEGSCGNCGGSGLLVKEKVLDVKIIPGSCPGDVLVFEGECSDHPDFDKAGDVHIILGEAEEDTPFRREAEHLYMEMEISLLDSLVGCERRVHGHPGYPSGLEISIPAGTQNRESMEIKGKGMPKKGTETYGSLFVNVKVNVSGSERKVLIEKKEGFKFLFGGGAAGAAETDQRS
jgi:DnaJ-class molecular chaperone